MPDIAVFCHRAKLYRYESATKEWKERGVGEMKILHHPGKKTYRLLLRREQVTVFIFSVYTMKAGYLSVMIWSGHLDYEEKHQFVIQSLLIRIIYISEHLNR